MDIDPMEAVETEDEGSASEAREKRKSRLNAWVAVTVALLATFLGLCKIKDDNIVQAMQQAQAKSIDSWAWYQAKKIRLQAAQQAVDQFEVQKATALPAALPVIAVKIAAYKEQTAKQTAELASVEKQAKGYDADYDRRNFHDDQFDLSDALLAIAISMLALTSLTQKRWLFGVAMVPTFCGVLMGLAGLFGWHIHPDWLTNLLS